LSELVPYASIVKSNNGINGITDDPIPTQELGLDNKYYANDIDNDKYYANDTSANKINKYLLARYQNRQDLSKYTKDANKDFGFVQSEGANMKSNTSKDNP
jgi:hypothetical protein